VSTNAQAAAIAGCKGVPVIIPVQTFYLIICQAMFEDTIRFIRIKATPVLAQGLLERYMHIHNPGMVENLLRYMLERFRIAAVLAAAREFDQGSCVVMIRRVLSGRWVRKSIISLLPEAGRPTRINMSKVSFVIAQIKAGCVAEPSAPCK
jgi:hypothetical protein